MPNRGGVHVRTLRSGLDPAHLFDMHASLQSAEPVGGECLTRLSTTPTCLNVGLHSNRSFKPRNPVMKRHRSTHFFQTLNQAKIVWDTRCKMKGLFGGHLNIRSMTPKREQLEHLLCNSNIDFLGLSETWLNCSSANSVVNMSGYNVFRKDREQGRGGGVLLYIKSTLKCNQIEWPSDVSLECVGVDISLSAEMSFILICMYRKPSAKLDFYDQLKQLLNHCDLKKEVIIMGDFNINWNEGQEKFKTDF